MKESNKPVLLDEKKTLGLSDIVDNAKVNNANGFADRSKLDGLQEWVREQIKIYNK